MAWSVIIADAVSVMYMFGPFKDATQNRFHDQPMLHYITMVCGAWVIWFIDIDIAA